MWKEIKKLVLREQKNSIKSIVFNGKEYKDELTIAKKFNEYFIESVKEIRESIEDLEYVNYVIPTASKFKFRQITIDELKEICKSLKNKTDFDRISPRTILDNWSQLGKTLLDLVNRSISTGEFPNSWKDSMITPVEKVPNTKKNDEFRPINTLRTVEKIIETVVKQQLMKYMEENNIFSEYQSGFRKNYSCETAVNHVINEWKDGGKRKKVIALFLDFKRAFETIDREILLKKMYNYGIQDKELSWFRTFLANRVQRTKVNNSVSDFAEVELGVPQGSILGALLFIIYINDMPKVVRNCKIVLYADDTLIYAEGKDAEECKYKLSCDIEHIITWLKINKLKLNEQKTKLMNLNLNNDTCIEINGRTIENVRSIKYLGMIIDKELNFNEHVDYICKKIGKKIGFFKRIRKKMDNITAVIVYNTMVKPHFEYCGTILYSCCNQGQLERLQKLQNKAMRSILKCNRYTPIRCMLDALKWLSIKQRLELNTLLAVFKVKYGAAPRILTRGVRRVGEIQPYPLRNANNFRVRFQNTAAGQNTFIYKGLCLFNTLPNDIKNEANLRIFKRKCIEFVKTNT